MEMDLTIQPLQEHHNNEEFSCGNEELDDWFRRTARQQVRKGISRTYIATRSGTENRVAGFYCLTVGEAVTEDLPNDLAKKLPRRIPIVLIGRLAVSADLQGNGIGAMLLVDALQRVVQVSKEVGVCAIVVDAKDERAAQFYEHFGFLLLPDSDGRRLVLPIQTAAALMETMREGFQA